MRASRPMLIRAFIVFHVLMLGALIHVPTATASSDVSDMSNQDSLIIEVDRRSTETGTPISRSRRNPTLNSPNQNRSTNSDGGGGGRSSNRQATVDPRAKWARSVLRTICTIDGNFGTSFGQCAAPAPAAPTAPAPAVPAPQSQTQIVSEPVTITITSSDLLELIPNSPEILTDRGPWGLKNAHTNLYASHHEPQTVTQTMFDQEVTITASPVEYRWDYGDGDTLVTEQPGYPVEIFNTETDTSHQYQETGLYSVTLTTVFEGTYQVDGGEVQEVSSTVTQQADPVDIRIYRAVTRNVDQTCADNPEAWGCDMPEN